MIKKSSTVFLYQVISLTACPVNHTPILAWIQTHNTIVNRPALGVVLKNPPTSQGLERGALGTNLDLAPRRLLHEYYQHRKPHTCLNHIHMLKDLFFHFRLWNIVWASQKQGLNISNLLWGVIEKGRDLVMACRLRLSSASWTRWVCVHFRPLRISS